MPLRLAVLPDFPAEGWPSMDLCADMLLAHLPTAERVCPPFRRLATRLPVVGKKNAAFNADRLLNRFVTFPDFARRNRTGFDCFHVADHTYAQLVHSLPADRTGVYCHDLDAFRCLLDPARDPRPWWFRRLARRILAGLQRAAVVFHSTRAVKEELLAWGGVEPGRLVHAPYGVSEEFTPDGTGLSVPWLDGLTGSPWVLHVGSCIPRKRIDVLLQVVATARQRLPDLKLVKVGGEWTADQKRQLDRLELSNAVVHVTGLSRPELAEVYRRAPVVLVPSESEGFGLPVVEALACGGVVVASDLPVLREVGGDVVTYRPVGAVNEWAEAAVNQLSGQVGVPERTARLAWAGRYSWATHAGTIAAAYERILRGEPPCGSSS
jgi:glycosyltransferase involved in cell wall biosynthesis